MTTASLNSQIYEFFGYGPGYGTLDNTSFTAVSTHTVHSVDYHVEGTTGVLIFGIQGSSALSAAEKQQLTLHVCDEPLAFHATPAPTDTGMSQSYRWTNPGVDWTGHAERTLYISRDQVAPAIESATVNGTTLVITFSEDLGAAASLADSAFTVKKTPSGASETTATLSGTPSISGKKLTLTLASGSSVTPTDGSVKVTYTKPTTGANNKLVDDFGNEVAAFSDEPVTNLLADSDPPGLSTTTPATLAADGLTLTLTYDEALKTTSTPAAGAFTVKATPAGGTEETLDLADTNPVSVIGSTVVLKLKKPIAHNDSSVKVTYAKPSSNAIKDANNNDAPAFNNQAVTNNSLVPRVLIAAVRTEATPGISEAEFLVQRSNFSTSPLTVQISFQQDAEYLSSTSGTITIPANDNKATDTFPSTYSGNVSGDLTATVAGGDDHLPVLTSQASDTVEMKLPPSGPVLSITVDDVTVSEGETAQLMVRFLTGENVVKPRIEGQVNAATSAGTAARNVDFAPFSGLVSVVVGDWARNSNQRYEAAVPVPVETVEDDEHEAAEQFQLILSPATGQPALFDTNDTATVTINDDDPLKVTEIAVTSTPGSGSHYGVAEMIKFSVTFNGEVRVTGTPQFSFRLGSETRTANYESGSDSKVLVFSYPVVSGDDDHDGISWSADPVSLNGGTIKFRHDQASKQVAATRDFDSRPARPSHKVDTTAPSFEEASADGTTLTIAFSEELRAANPPTSAFTVKVAGGAGVNPSGVSVSGRSVTLTLSTAIVPGQSVTVSYTKPATNPLEDLSGKDVESFTDENVTTAPPVEVTVRFEQAVYFVNENGTVDIIVNLDKDPERTVAIPITATPEGDASPADDYSVPSSVTFNSGETQQTLTFTAKDDTIDDDGEGVQLAIGSSLPGGVTAGTPTQTLVNIVDDDHPDVTVNFALNSYRVGEGSTVTISVTLSADPERTINIPIQASPLDDTVANDYSVPSSVTFNTGQTQQTLRLVANQDDDGDDENVRLSIGSSLPERVSAGTPAVTTVGIDDNDVPRVTVSRSSLDVVQGSSATYTVRLNTDPGADATVTVAPSSGNPVVTVTPAALTFTADDWDTPQPVTVRATAGSAGAKGDIMHAVSGYPGVTAAPDVAVTVIVRPSPPPPPPPPPPPIIETRESDPVFTIAPPQPPRTVSNFQGVEPLFQPLSTNGSLVRVWRFLESSMRWLFYDPRPAFASFNTMRIVNLASDPPAVAILQVSRNQRFRGMPLYAGWNFVPLTSQPLAPRPGSGPQPIAELVRPLAETGALQRVWWLDSRTQEWKVYDPRTQFVPFNTLSTVDLAANPPVVLAVSVDRRTEFRGRTLYRGWNYVVMR